MNGYFIDALIVAFYRYEATPKFKTFKQAIKSNGRCFDDAEIKSLYANLVAAKNSGRLRELACEIYHRERQNGKTLFSPRGSFENCLAMTLKFLNRNVKKDAIDFACDDGFNDAIAVDASPHTESPKSCEGLRNLFFKALATVGGDLYELKKALETGQYSEKLISSLKDGLWRTGWTRDYFDLRF